MKKKTCIMYKEYFNHPQGLTLSTPGLVVPINLQYLCCIEYYIHVDIHVDVCFMIVVCLIYDSCGVLGPDLCFMSGDFISGDSDPICLQKLKHRNQKQYILYKYLNINTIIAGILDTLFTANGCLKRYSLNCSQLLRLFEIFIYETPGTLPGALPFYSIDSNTGS